MLSPWVIEISLRPASNWSLAQFSRAAPSGVWSTVAADAGFGVDSNCDRDLKKCCRMSSGHGAGMGSYGREAEDRGTDRCWRHYRTSPSHDVFGATRARAARSGHTEFELKRLEVPAALANSTLDVAIRDSAADANDHGKLRESVLAMQL